VIFGGPGDRAAADRILAGMPAGTVDLVGATKLPDVPAFLEQAGVLVGVDTGLTHIGIAVRRPVVALFGSTCPYTRGADSPLRVMYDALPCAPCKRNPTCGGANTCMRGLTPERVARTALEIAGGA
jgi:heptosyltransferase-1